MKTLTDMNTAVMPALRKLTVEVADDDVSGKQAYVKPGLQTNTQ